MSDWISEHYSKHASLNLRLLENYIIKLFDIIQVPITLLDAQGNILIASKWTTICDDFFRSHPETERKCLETCSHINHQSQQLFTCPNGLKMRKSPICIGDTIIAHLVISQFLEHQPDLDFFLNIATKMSYDSKSFMKAIEEVPIIPLKKLQQIMDFVDEFIVIVHNLIEKQLISQTLEEEVTQSYEELEASYQDISSLNDQLNILNNNLTLNMEELYKSEKKYSVLFNNMSQGVLRYLESDSTSSPVQYSLIEYNTAIERHFDCPSNQLTFEHVKASPLVTYISDMIKITPIFKSTYYHAPQNTYLDITSEMVISNEIHVWVTDATATHRKLEFQKKQMWDLISTMGKLVEKRDLYTADHQKRVAIIATRIAIELQLSRNEIESIYIASLLHDIGKISIPSEILTKPDKLTPIEYELIKTHVNSGYEILKKIDFELPVADIINQHHEKIDGSGYPNGIKGSQMLMASKIVSVADVFEAIISHRPYRPSLGIDFAIKYLRDESGKLFDIDVVEACIKLSLLEEWTLDDVEKYLQYKS